MHSLKELQENLLQSIMGNNLSPESIKQNNNIDIADRLAVHRDTILENFISSLKITYPGVWKLIGNDCARGVALAYSHNLSNLKTRAEMNFFGDEFPEFLKNFESTNHLQYLHDFATLELLRSKSYGAINESCLSAEDMRDFFINGDEGGEFELNSSVYFLKSKFPLMNIQELLNFSVQQGSSDLHVTAGMPPLIRVDGDIRRINVDPMDHKEVHYLIYEIMNDKQRKDYEEFLETDFSFDVPSVARFRVNAFNQNRGAGAVFRTIPSKVLSMEELGMGKVFQNIASLPRGIVLVTGPTGSGKSTTLAAMIDYINTNQYHHILTIEDPIEFVHESKKSLINQREVHRDTHGFNEALRSALQEVGLTAELLGSSSDGSRSRSRMLVRG